MRKLLLPALLVLFVSGCNSSDPKEMATALCDCVKNKKEISSRSKKIMIKAAKSDNYMTAVQEQLENIEDATEREEVQDDINTVAKAFQSKKTQDCANEVDKKYKVYKSQEKEMQKKMIDEMAEIDDCEVYAAVIKAGMKAKQSTADDETTDEEKPKKKVTSDEEE